MGNGAKLALVGVLALIVLVVAVWDRQNEERHQDGMKSPPTIPADAPRSGVKVKVVTSQPSAQDRMSGTITQGPLSTQSTLSPGGKAPLARKPEVAAPAPAPETGPARGTTVVDAPAPGKRYVLKATDTLASIALREYGSKSAWKRIADANKGVIKDSARLPVGKEIVIPPMEVAEAKPPATTVVKPALSHTTEVSALPAAVKTYTVEKGDTLAKIALKLLGSKDKWKTIQDANKDKLPSETSLKVGQELVIPGAK